MKKRVRILLIVSFLIALAIFFYTNSSLSKYISDKISSYFIKSKDFYFTSNLLGEKKASYTIGSWSGVGPFSISVKVFSKDPTVYLMVTFLVSPSK